MRYVILGSVLALAAFHVGCNKSTDTAKPESAAAAPGAVTGTTTTTALGLSSKGARAEVGQPAPDFTLKDTEGNAFKLEGAKGKVVVLEWFNPDCPFVRKSHEKGSLKGLADKEQKEGVVWVAVNSNAAGKQGHGAAHNAERKKEWSLQHPILMDEDGEVGHAYGATNTPHMYVIDPSGKLVYAGAIDNSPDGEGESPTSGKLVNYVDQAIHEIAGGKAVSVASTKAYGCSVKYK